MGLRWRTYATKNFHGATGEWKAEINDTEGKVINEVKFKMEWAEREATPVQPALPLLIANHSNHFNFNIRILGHPGNFDG